MQRFPLCMRKFSTNAVWEAGRKARESARALASLPNEDRNSALERVAAALESARVEFVRDKKRELEIEILSLNSRHQYPNDYGETLYLPYSEFMYIDPFEKYFGRVQSKPQTN